MMRIGHFSKISLLALGAALPAVAQNTTATTTPQATATAQPLAAEEAERDVVVVTANKRQESVQDVAVAVTAVTSEMRDEIGINTINHPQICQSPSNLSSHSCIKMFDVIAGDGDAEKDNK